MARGKFRAFVANRRYHRARQRTETGRMPGVRERSRDRLIDNVSEGALYTVLSMQHAVYRCAGCAFNRRFFDKCRDRHLRDEEVVIRRDLFSFRVT